MGRRKLDGHAMKILSALLWVIMPVAMAIWASPACSQDKVKVVGMAGIHNDAIDIARDKAIDNAQRNAVEEKIGVLISSFSEVENYQVKVDQILSESRGFINSYKVLSEGREGDTYKVVIEADVGTGKLQDRMEAIKLLMVRKEKPRLMLLFSGREQKDSQAEAVMSRYFLGQGYTVIDSATAHYRPSEDGAGVGADAKALTNLAHRFGAEVIVAARVEARMRTFKMGEIEVSTHELTVSGRVFNGDTGEMIASGSRTEKGELKNATDEAATKLARALHEEIIDRWSAETTSAVTVKLYVTGLKSYADTTRFKEMLTEHVKGLKKVYQRSFRKGRLELDLSVRGNTQGVADDLAALTFKGKKLHVSGMTQNTITADF